MELMQEHALPTFGEVAQRIGTLSEPFGNHGGTLGCVAEVLVLAVVKLHGSLGGVASRAVNVHEQLSVMHRQLGMILVRQEVLVYLVARRAYYLYRTVTLYSFSRPLTDARLGEPPVSPVP